MTNGNPGVLAGVTVVWTGSEKSGQRIIRALHRVGATVLCRPLIRTRNLFNDEGIADLLLAGPDYEWVVVSSAKAAAGLPTPERVPSFRGTMALVGPATAAVVREKGWSKLVVPDIHDALHLAKMIRERSVPGQKVLCFQGNLSPDTIPELLRHAGLEVTTSTVYETVPETPAGLMALVDVIRTRADGVIVGSPSGVDALESVWRGPLDQLKVGLVWLCLGSTTAKRLSLAGIEGAIFPASLDESTMLSAFVPPLVAARPLG